MKKSEYDFWLGNYTSAPSSIKLINDELDQYWESVFDNVPLEPGSQISVKVNIKQKNIHPIPDRPPVLSSRINFSGRNVAGESRWLKSVIIPLGDFDWRTFAIEFMVPSDIITLDVAIAGAGSKTPSEPGVTWFDDLYVYQNGGIIYENHFTALRPGKIIPTVIKPPEIIVSAVQRFKTGRADRIEEPLRVPLAIASI